MNFKAYTLEELFDILIHSDLSVDIRSKEIINAGNLFVIQLGEIWTIDGQGNKLVFVADFT